MPIPKLIVRYEIAALDIPYTDAPGANPRLSVDDRLMTLPYPASRMPAPKICEQKKVALGPVSTTRSQSSSPMSQTGRLTEYAASFTRMSTRPTCSAT
jgi:hypothetical protein